MFHVRVYPVSVLPHHGCRANAGVKCVCVRVCLQDGSWQQHIWLLSGPWSCNSDLEVLRCLFIARSLGAWPLFPVTFAAINLQTYCDGVPLWGCIVLWSHRFLDGTEVAWTRWFGWNSALIQLFERGCRCWVIDIPHNINTIKWMTGNI